jgi:hypothetical protein
MADWKQITARIRRARTSKEPAAQLSNLYEKTRDAMVAFELAKFFESTGQNADASKWYAAAAERFRRADWKIKAQEAAVRLGGEAGTLSSEPVVFATMVEPVVPIEQNAEMLESLVAVSSEAQDATDESEETPAISSAPGDKKHRRRGRRGGRNRKKPGAPRDAAVVPAARAEHPSAPSRGLPAVTYAEPAEAAPERATHSKLTPQLPLEPIADPGGANVRGRYGDPGLSSRLSLLEMQFRRLMTCAPVKLNEADMAPVGPGVFVLTDSDLTSYYYVEACQTLRIAVGNLLRGGTSRRGADSIKPQLAGHLGIAEARVPKYLADHCVVRWLQLDEGASHFAHFVIAVLRPIRPRSNPLLSPPQNPLTGSLYRSTPTFPRSPQAAGICPL